MTSRFRRKSMNARKRGNSCTESELWNNLTAPRHIASAGFFLGPDWGVGRGERGCGRSGKWEVCNASYAAGQELLVVRSRTRESHRIWLINLSVVELRNSEPV